jgi:hypothetical protein
MKALKFGIENSLQLRTRLLTCILYILYQVCSAKNKYSVKMQFNIFIPDVLRRKKGPDSASFFREQIFNLHMVRVSVSDLDIKDKRM